MVAQFSGQAAGGGQHFRFVRRHAHRLFKTAFGVGKLVTQAIASPQVQQDSGIGRVQPAGALQQFNALLEITPRPGFIRRLQASGSASREKSTAVVSCYHCFRLKIYDLRAAPHVERARKSSTCSRFIGVAYRK